MEEVGRPLFIVLTEGYRYSCSESVFLGGNAMSAALKSAIESNDPTAVRDALADVKDVNAKVFDGQTAVSFACHIGADQALRALLEAKAKVQGKYAEHPFVIAALHQHHHVMQVLFDRKKTPDDAMNYALNRIIREGLAETLEFMLRQFKPPVTMDTIMIAGQFGHAALIRILGEHGADLNMEGSIGRKRTPALHIVVRTGHIETIRAMVECGAQVNARDQGGVTPLMELADAAPELDRQLAGYHDYQLRLRERAKEAPQRAEEILNSPAAKQPPPPSAEEALRALLDLGAEGGLKDSEGNDALDYYRFQCRRSKQTPEAPTVVEVLQRAGAKGDDATFKLFATIAAGDAGGVRQAVAAGADVNRISPAHGSENTPLTLAAHEGNLDMVAALLDAKADPNKAAGNDRPLHAACQQGHVAVVQRLIAAGADVSLRQLYAIADDCPAMNAYEMARWASQKAVLKYLRSIGADDVGESKGPEAGVHSWDDFAEVLAKGDVPTVAAVVAKMIDGKVQTDVYEKAVVPGQHAYLVGRPIGMVWCNIFQLAPLVDWLDDRTGQKFAAALSENCRAPVLYIGYTDTSDAAISVRYEPGAKPKKKNGKESENDWLVDLAKKERFVVAAFRPVVHAGKPVDIMFSGFSADAFDEIAYISS
jgi:ankyrin repeat protein